MVKFSGKQIIRNLGREKGKVKQRKEKTEKKFSNEKRQERQEENERNIPI